MVTNDQRIMDYVINEHTFISTIHRTLESIDTNMNTFQTEFPHVSNKHYYKKESNKLWTASFFPGMVYIAYALTGEDKYLRNKEYYLNSFEERSQHGQMNTHDIGFLYTLSCIALYKLTGNEGARQISLEAADKLVVRYNEEGQYIQAWGKMGISVPNVKIIIDCMMNLPLLYWASNETGDKKYYEIARKHAATSSETLVREDGSTYHTYLMDPTTGRRIGGKTHQGRCDETTWARGQAWSIYGFTLSYLYTKEEKFLETAIKSADYFIKNLPENFIPYWDFSYTDVDPDVRDTSAASIAACGFYHLAQVVKDKEKQELYDKTAKVLLHQLCTEYFLHNEANGLLKEGLYHRDHEFNECTIWGDYFFVEGLYIVTQGDPVRFW